MISLGGSSTLCFLPPPLGHPPHEDGYSDGWPRTLEEKGVKGGSPHAASPFGGERGSPSYLPKNSNLVTGIKKKFCQGKCELFLKSVPGTLFTQFFIRDYRIILLVQMGLYPLKKKGFLQSYNFKKRVLCYFNTWFFLKNRSRYIPVNTPGGFCNAFAPAVAATPARG